MSKPAPVWKIDPTTKLKTAYCPNCGEKLKSQYYPPTPVHDECVVFYCICGYESDPE